MTAEKLHIWSNFTKYLNYRQDSYTSCTCMLDITTSCGKQCNILSELIRNSLFFSVFFFVIVILNLFLHYMLYNRNIHYTLRRSHLIFNYHFTMIHVNWSYIGNNFVYEDENIDKCTSFWQLTWSDQFTASFINGEIRIRNFVFNTMRRIMTFAWRFFKCLLLKGLWKMFLRSFTNL